MTARSCRIAATSEWNLWMDIRVAIAWIFMVAACPHVSQAEDWPQWMGPNRDNVWRAENIVERIPPDGPKIVWRAQIAGGYAGPAVVGDRLFATDYVLKKDATASTIDLSNATGIERVMCLDAATGRMVWKHDYPVKYSIDYPAGPRCTPLVDSGRVYFLGAEGQLHCCNAADGAIVWSRDIRYDYQTKTATWGYAAHPLIDGERLICTVGGAGTHTVAFDKATGKELWRYGTASEQGYSPPSIFEFAGVRQLILMSPNWIASVAPETGREYWTEKYEATNGSIIMTPVKIDRYLYVGGFNNRSLMLQLSSDKPGAKALWRDKPKAAMSPVNVQPFVDDKTIYGFHGSGELMAMQVPEGNRLWATGWPIGERPVSSGTAFIVRHRDRYLLFAETGELLFVRLTPEGHSEIDRAKIIEPTGKAFGRSVVWSAPAFANGRMYVRNDKECVCVELSKP